MFAIVSILKFNIMMLITFYYLKMASEQIFTRTQYIRFKWTLITAYSIFMTLMVYSALNIFIDLYSKAILHSQLCISWHYMSLKWGELICSVIFLIITVLVQIKIEDDFKRKLLKVNFEQIIFKERFQSEET